MLINPVSFRLSISIFWNSTWSIYKNYNYKYLFYSDLVFFEFFMFFFKKTLNLRFLDFYPSHIRLYRLNNKTIVNLYYHIAKEEYYFDEIDWIYKDFIKKMPIAKKNIYTIKKNIYVFEKRKSLRIIKKTIFKLIFKYIYLKKNILYLKTSLVLLFKKIKKYFNIKLWNLTKKIIKKYFLNIKNKYIYLFFKYIYLKNKKKKKLYINPIKLNKKRIKLVKKISKEIIKLNNYKTTLIKAKK